MNFETKLRYIQQPQIALESLFIKLASMESCLVVRDVLSGNVQINSTQNSEPVILEDKSKVVVHTMPEATSKVVENTPKSAIEQVVANEPPEVVEEKITEPKSEVDLNLQKIIDGWSAVISEIEKNNSKISNLLEEVKLEGFSSSVLSILLTRDQKFHAKSLQKDSSKIEAVLQDIYGSKIKLNFTIEESSASQKDEKKKVNEEDKEHPLFMKALEIFEGEVLR